MILGIFAGSVRQNVHSGVPCTAMLADYQGAHIGGSARVVWPCCVRPLPHPIWEFAQPAGSGALPALPGMRRRRLGS